MSRMIVGIDEVGRGPWAGPLVVGAVVLGCEIDGLTDSKKLSKKKREALNAEIVEKAVGVGLGWAHAAELDQIGLSAALALACRRALEQISAPYHQIIIDGTVNLLKDTGKGPYVTTMKKADLLVPSVSAASIVAKVARDEFMTAQDEKYPNYGFSKHVGYGTAMHHSALQKYGATPLHRRSFGPLKEIKQSAEPATVQITTRLIGSKSEDVAAKYLNEKGYLIVECNWKTKACEIDIIAQKDNKLFFVEVKHRKSASQGGGLAAITPKKLKQMKFAANMYIHWNNLYGREARLCVVSTSGEQPEVGQFLQID